MGMQFYQLFMFIHVACVIIWLGCAFSLSWRGEIALQRGDEEGLIAVVNDAFGIFDRVFGPTATGALIGGLVMTWLAWDFRELWILVGLGGFAVSAIYGVMVVSAQKKELDGFVARHGVRSPAAIRQMRRLLIAAQFETLVLFVVVADMIFKPQPDSAITLAIMASAVIAGGWTVWRRVRAVNDAPR